MDVGVIGTGLMGANHARVYSSIKGIESVYVYDKDYEKAKKVAEQYDCLLASSMDALLDCVDAVSVVVPTKYHFEIAKACIESGKHTLVEKPICKTKDEARQLCAIASGMPDLVLGVGHIERFNPVVTFIRENITNPKYISITRHNPGSDRITDSTVVEDLMIHDLDIIATFVNLHSEYLPIAAVGNDDTYVTIIDNGFPIVLSASRRATKKTRQIYIEEEEKTIVGDFVEQSVHVYHKPEVYNLYASVGVVARINIPRVEALNAELSTFIWCIQSKKPFPITFEEGRIMLELCEIVKSSNPQNVDLNKPQVRKYDIG